MTYDIWPSLSQVGKVARGSVDVGFLNCGADASRCITLVGHSYFSSYLLCESQHFLFILLECWQPRIGKDHMNS